MFALSQVPLPDVAGLKPAPAQKSWAESVAGKNEGEKKCQKRAKRETGLILHVFVGLGPTRLGLSFLTGYVEHESRAPTGLLDG